MPGSTGDGRMAAQILSEVMKDAHTLIYLPTPASIAMIMTGTDNFLALYELGVSRKNTWSLPRTQQVHASWCFADFVLRRHRPQTRRPLAIMRRV